MIQCDTSGKWEIAGVVQKKAEASPAVITREKMSKSFNLKKSINNPQLIDLSTEEAVKVTTSPSNKTEEENLDISDKNEISTVPPSQKVSEDSNNEKEISKKVEKTLNHLASKINDSVQNYLSTKNCEVKKNVKVLPNLVPISSSVTFGNQQSPVKPITNINSTNKQVFIVSNSNSVPMPNTVPLNSQENSAIKTFKLNSLQMPVKQNASKFTTLAISPSKELQPLKIPPSSQGIPVSHETSVSIQDSNSSINTSLKSTASPNIPLHIQTTEQSNPSTAPCLFYLSNPNSPNSPRMMFVPPSTVPGNNFMLLPSSHNQGDKMRMLLVPSTTLSNKVMVVTAPQPGIIIPAAKLITTSNANLNLTKSPNGQPLNTLTNISTSNITATSLCSTTMTTNSFKPIMSNITLTNDNSNPNPALKLDFGASVASNNSSLPSSSSIAHSNKNTSNIPSPNVVDITLPNESLSNSNSSSKTNDEIICVENTVKKISKTKVNKPDVILDEVKSAKSLKKNGYHWTAVDLSITFQSVKLEWLLGTIRKNILWNIYTMSKKSSYPVTLSVKNGASNSILYGLARTYEKDNVSHKVLVLGSLLCAVTSSTNISDDELFLNNSIKYLIREETGELSSFSYDPMGTCMIKLASKNKNDQDIGKKFSIKKMRDENVLVTVDSKEINSTPSNVTAEPVASQSGCNCSLSGDFICYGHSASESVPNKSEAVALNKNSDLTDELSDSETVKINPKQLEVISNKKSGKTLISPPVTPSVHVSPSSPSTDHSNKDEILILSPPKENSNVKKIVSTNKPIVVSPNKPIVVSPRDVELHDSSLFTLKDSGQIKRKYKSISPYRSILPRPFSRKYATFERTDKSGGVSIQLGKVLKCIPSNRKKTSGKTDDENDELSDSASSEVIDQNKSERVDVSINLDSRDDSNDGNDQDFSTITLDDSDVDVDEVDDGTDGHKMRELLLSQRKNDQDSGIYLHY